MSNLMIVVAKFRPNQIADFMSETLILSVDDESRPGVTRTRPERGVSLEHIVLGDRFHG